MTVEQTQEDQPLSSATVTDEQLQELADNASFQDASDTPLEETVEDRPEWLPEQFKTPEEMAKSYTELRSKMDSGASKDEATTDTKEDKEGGDQETSTEEDAEKTTSKQESVDSAFSEYSEKGELSEDTYTSLEKAGFDKPLVDAYIAGQVALQESLTHQLTEAAGGDPAQLLEWGKSALTPEQIAVHDKAMSGTVAEAKAAVELLKSRFDKAKGSRGEFFGKGGSKSAGSGLNFNEQSDIVEAMNDPRYARSETYRQEVDEAIRKMAFS